MTSELGRELMKALQHKNATERQMTIKVEGEVIGILDKYRTAKSNKEGGSGRLEGYGEVAAKLIRFADEVLSETRSE